MSLTGRILLAALCLGVSLIGFMIKLPAVFRGHDKELHTLFYFLAAGFLNVLFVKRNVVGHVLVFGLLYAMGAGIEYAQEYSNSFGQRIHGRYDPEDIAANLKGLLYFSILWAGYVIVWYATRSIRATEIKTETNLFPSTPVATNISEASRENKPSLNRFPDPQDEAQLRLAIELLTGVINRNPDHPASGELKNAVSELKKQLLR